MMKSVQVFKGDDGIVASRLVDIDKPDQSKLDPHQLIIKVHVSGSNPKDWKIPILVPALNNSNSGDDIVGTVVSIGSEVTEFKPGDRVAAFHEMTKEFGSFAEYAVSFPFPAQIQSNTLFISDTSFQVAWEHTTFMLPKHVSDEEGASIPLAAMTAAVGLFTSLGLPEPWVKDAARRENCAGGCIVYGAASAVGAFAIKLLVKSDIHPIICVAGNGIDFVEGLIDRSKGDTIVDYRKGEAAIVQGLKDGVKEGHTLKYAFDAVTDHGIAL